VSDLGGQLAGHVERAPGGFELAQIGEYGGEQESQPGAGLEQVAASGLARAVCRPDSKTPSTRRRF